MKEQKSVRAVQFQNRYIKIYIATAILCLLVAIAISFTVIKLNSERPIPPSPEKTVEQTLTSTPPQATQTPQGTAKPTTPPTTLPVVVDPSKIDTVIKTQADSKYGSLVLVNKTYTFDPTTALKDLVIIKETSGVNITVAAWQDRISRDTLTALCQLQTAMEKDLDTRNLILCTTEPYIDKTKDENGDMVDNITGEHSTGLAVNLKFHNKVDFSQSASLSSVSDLYEYIKQNSWKFGLILRYPSDKSEQTNNKGEASHLRYVGKVHAEYMYKNNLCLEEYLERLKDYNFNKPLTFKAIDGQNYYIYYVAAAESGDTTIHLRKDTSTESYGEAEISGTNCGGFIILQPYTKK